MEETMMKKLLALVLAMAMMLALVACGGNNSSKNNTANNSTNNTTANDTADNTANDTADDTTTNEPAAPQLGSEPVEITFWHSASDEAGILMDKYVQEFNANNEYQITVNAIYQGQYSDATTLLRTMLSGENYDELPDVMQMDATGKMTYYNSGKAYTVDQAIADFADESFLDSYLAGALGNWQFAGTQLGLPFATSTTVTYYNMDLLAQAGWDKAPDTFADVIALYEDMQAADMTAKVYQAVPNTPTLANWIGQLGSYVVNEQNGSAGTASELDCIDNGALETFMTEWKAMYDAGALLNEASSIDLFIAGDIAVYTSSSSNVTSVLAKVGGAFEVGVSNYLRVNDSASYGATVSGSCVTMFDSGDAMKKAAAWEFVKYLTGAAVQADFGAGTGYIPAHMDALADPTYVALTEEYPQYTVAFDQLSATPADMRSVTVGPTIDFYYAIQDGVSGMLADDLDPAEATEFMAEDLQLLLDDYIRNNQ